MSYIDWQTISKETEIDISDSMIAQIENPRWEWTERVHDWRNHIPAIIREHWLEIDPVLRLYLFEGAEVLARTEEWD